MLRLFNVVFRYFTPLIQGWLMFMPSSSLAEFRTTQSKLNFSSPLKSTRPRAGRFAQWLLMVAMANLVVACGGGGGGDSPAPTTGATLQSIQITPATPSIAAGTTVQMTATGIYSDNSHKDLTTAVSWTSATAAVATVSTVGLAQGLSIGSSDIGVNYLGKSATLALAVTNATLVSIAVTPSSSVIAAGTTQQFTATGMFTDNSTQDLTTSVTWASDADGTATVSNAAGTNGGASAVAVGTASITATLGAITSANAPLTVTNATLRSLAITPANPSVAAGITQQFVATGTFTDGSTQDLTSSVTWASATPAVTTISNMSGSRGWATALVAGTSNIVASQGSISATATQLTVTAATLTSIAVTPAGKSAAIGTTQQFTAIGTFSDSSTQNMTTTLTWGSSNTAAATISNAAGSQGLASALAAGTTTVTATSGSVSGTAGLTVTSATLVSIAVTPANVNAPAGSARQFTATGTYSDSSTQNLTSALTWTSSNTSVATVSNVSGSNGLVSVLSTAPPGATSTITATCAQASVCGSVSGNTTLTVNLGFAFTANFNGNSVSAFSIAANGQLTQIGAAVPSSGSQTYFLVAHPNGKYLYATNVVSGTVSLFNRAANGALSPMVPATITAGTNPLNIAIDPTGSYLYVANKGSNTISQFTIGANGVPVPMATATVTTDAGPWGLVVDKTGTNVYVSNSVTSSVQQFPIGVGGALGASTTTVTTGTGFRPLAIDPSNKYLYVAAQGNQTVAAFSIGAGGALTSLGATVFTSANPQALVVDPSGKYVYVATSVNIMNRYTIGVTGALSGPVNTTAGGGNLWGLAFDPTGAFLYLSDISSVQQYSFNGATGNLTALSPFLASAVTPISIITTK